MNILVYCWNSNSEPDIISTLESLNHKVLCTHRELHSYENASEIEAIFKETLENTNFITDAIFSFDYYPAIGEYSHKHNIPYISWIYDCPHLTVLSPTVKYPEVYLFLFDRDQINMVSSIGAPNVFHLPLAVNSQRLNQLLGNSFGKYKHDVSFVGSLYDNNGYDKINYLPKHLRGYLDGVIKAQQQLWGIDIISELITDNITDEMNRYISIDLSSHYLYTKSLLYTHFLQTKVTSLDRKELLTAIPNNQLSLFTTPGVNLPSGTNSKGFVSYFQEMPKIFRESKININITLRSITSGIPLRCIDIMGSGGFLLSNFQPELEEFFINGEDYVYFEDQKDFLSKIQYYLLHDNEREQIAQNGYRKVSENFTYEKAVNYMLSCLSK